MLDKRTETKIFAQFWISYTLIILSFQISYDTVSSSFPVNKLDNAESYILGLLLLRFLRVDKDIIFA